jgi:sugar/nucleoside kinase (ribokinase family)
VRRARAAYFSTNNLDFNSQLLDCLAPGIPVIHNLGMRFVDNPDYVSVMLNKANVIVGNCVELSNFTTLTGLRPYDMFSLSGSIETIIITDGQKGVRLFNRGEHTPINYPVLHVDQVRSPVGAGDSFAMGILWSMLSGKTPDDGIRLGMALGALAVASEESFPNLAKVKEIKR